MVPHAAYAQKKPKPPKTGEPPAPPAGGTGTAAAPADADADSAAPAATPPASGAATPPDQGGGGDQDICQITPDAPQCAAAKEINFGEEAKKKVHAEIYAVEQQFVMKAQRFEIQPYFAFTLNDQFVSHDAPGLALNYYITQVLAVGVNANWYAGLNADSDFNLQVRRAAHVAVPLNIYRFSAVGQFTYVPMYGKFAGFGDFIFNYDAYLSGGVGVIQTEPEAVIDPDNRKFDWRTKLTFDVGIGLRIFFTRWLAAVLEVRDLIFLDDIENVNVATGSLALPANDPTSPLNKSTWYDTNHLTNDVQFQVGLSIFLPTSFEYHLPK
jgi:outer membrane beta-barrel protein